MEVKIIKDRTRIFHFLSRTPELQLYAIGDLDDFFWSSTLWYALCDKDVIQSIALLYQGSNPPTLLLFSHDDHGNSMELLKSIISILPEEFNAHLSPGLASLFGKKNIIKNFGRNYRMILRKEPVEVTDENIRRLIDSDLSKIEELYAVAYPGNWFDHRMVGTGKYFGYFLNNMLAGVSGIHVFSARYRTAALGNIATHPDFRRLNIAFKLTSVLCKDLGKDVDIIGLNVKSDNLAAIKCYEKAGFTIHNLYDECLIRNVS